MKKVTVIIPAGGKGSRMGTKKSKQFLNLAGKTILQMTIEKFLEIDDIFEIIIVTSLEDVDETKKIISLLDTSKVIKVVIGGSTRQESVYNGTKEISSSSTIVLVHDGARPLIGEKEIRRCIDSVSESISVVVGVPVKDTIKVVDQSKNIINTPGRDTLWITQTPQGFSPQLLILAHERAKNDGFLGTDDSSLLERYGERVLMVMGTYDNIKVTTPEDLIIAERIIEREI